MTGEVSPKAEIVVRTLNGVTRYPGAQVEAPKEGPWLAYTEITVKAPQNPVMNAEAIESKRNEETPQ